MEHEANAQGQPPSAAAESAGPASKKAKTSAPPAKPQPVPGARAQTAQPTAAAAPAAVDKADLRGRHFSISWSCKTEVEDHLAGGEDVFVHRFVGTLQYQNYLYDDEPTTAGSVKAYKIRHGQFGDRGKDLYQHLDATDGELEIVAHLMRRLEGDEDDPNAALLRSPLGEAMLRRMGRTDVRGRELVNEIGPQMEICGQGDVLYIDHIEVKEEYRGFDLGLFLLDRADTTLNGQCATLRRSPRGFPKNGSV